MNKNKLVLAAALAGNVFAPAVPVLAAEDNSETMLVEVNREFLVVDSKIKGYNDLDKPTFTFTYYPDNNYENPKQGFKDQATAEKYTLKLYQTMMANQKPWGGELEVADLVNEMLDDPDVYVELKKGADGQVDVGEVSDFIFTLVYLIPFYFTPSNEDRFWEDVVSKGGSFGGTIVEQNGKIRMKSATWKYDTPEEVNKHSTSTTDRNGQPKTETPSVHSLEPGQQEAVDKAIQELIDGANMNWSDAQKAWYVASSILEGQHYDELDYRADGTTDRGVDNPGHNTAYGALVEKRSRCNGFAQSIAATLRKMGVPAYTVYGDRFYNGPRNIVGASSGVNHAWNVVLIDGQWVLLDITDYTEYHDKNGNLIPVDMEGFRNNSFLKGKDSEQFKEYKSTFYPDLPIPSQYEYTENYELTTKETDDNWKDYPDNYNDGDNEEGDMSTTGEDTPTDGSTDGGTDDGNGENPDPDNGSADDGSDETTDPDNGDTDDGSGDDAPVDSETEDETTTDDDTALDELKQTAKEEVDKLENLDDETKDDYKKQIDDAISKPEIDDVIKAANEENGTPIEEEDGSDDSNDDTNGGETDGSTDEDPSDDTTDENTDGGEEDNTPQPPVPGPTDGEDDNGSDEEETPDEDPLADLKTEYIDKIKALPTLDGGQKQGYIDRIDGATSQKEILDIFEEAMENSEQGSAPIDDGEEDNTPQPQPSGDDDNSESQDGSDDNSEQEDSDDDKDEDNSDENEGTEDSNEDDQDDNNQGGSSVVVHGNNGQGTSGGSNVTTPGNSTVVNPYKRVQTADASSSIDIMNAIAGLSMGTLTGMGYAISNRRKNKKK